MYIYIYTYIYICMYVYIYINIFIYYTYIEQVSKCQIDLDRQATDLRFWILGGFVDTSVAYVYR